MGKKSSNLLTKTPMGRQKEPCEYSVKEKIVSTFFKDCKKDFIQEEFTVMGFCGRGER